MNAPRKPARSGTRGYAHLVEINAPAARVWRALTDPALIRIWSGAPAEVDARQGGVYRIGRIGAGGREAHIDIYEPNRRLRLIYLSGAEFPPANSAIVDDFMLDIQRTEGMISLRLLGSGIPDESAWDQPYTRFRLGWERFLARIKQTLENPPQPKKSRTVPVDPPLAGLDY